MPGSQARAQAQAKSSKAAPELAPAASAGSAAGSAPTSRSRRERQRDVRARGAAAVLTIDRPERRNAVDGPTAELLAEAYERFEADDEARVLVLTGAGDVAFCAGADLKAIETLRARGSTTAATGPLGFTRLTPSKPTIAAISGWCLAGGLELALWCDLRIATEGSTLGFPERRFGVPLIDGGTQRLPRIVGLGRALDLILTGRIVQAEEAHDDGPGHRDRAARARTSSARSRSPRRSPRFPQETMLADRRAAIEGIGLPFEEGLALEAAERRAPRSRPPGEGAARFAGGEGRGGAGAGRLRLSPPCRSLAIEVSDLHKSYGAVEAVRGLSFEVERGEVFGLLGPNGAGKTTTVEILEGYRAPLGRPGVGARPRPRAARPAAPGAGRASCSRAAASTARVTVREAVEHFAKAYPAPRDPAETIALVGLEDKADARTNELSGGQRRRLDLALALVGDPELVFLDEPTTGFDPAARRTAWNVGAPAQGARQDRGADDPLPRRGPGAGRPRGDRQGRADRRRGPARGAVARRRSYRVSLPLARAAGSNTDTDDPTELLHRLTRDALARGERLEGLEVTRPTLEESTSS